jgi:hypothetical protein
LGLVVSNDGLSSAYKKSKIKKLSCTSIPWSAHGPSLN